jgi:hypothetical protein
VIGVKHTQQNQAPTVALGDALATSQDKGVLLQGKLDGRQPAEPRGKVSWANSDDANVHFCDATKAQTRAWFSAPGRRMP